MFREALELDRETLGSLHPDTLIAITNLAQDLQDQGKSMRPSRCIARR